MYILFPFCCYPLDSPFSLPIQLIEFFLPAFCVAILYIIKWDLQQDPNSSLKSTTYPATYPGADDVIIPLSFQDYVTALQANRTCIPDPTADPLQKVLGLAPLVISGIDFQDWPVPFVFCNSYYCSEMDEDATKFCTYKTLALAPMDSNDAGQLDSMRKFKSFIEEKYPQVTDKSLLPFEHDFIRTFNSNDEINEYVTSDKYYPKIAIGVVFSGKGGKSYDYTIRTNSTNYNSEELSVSAERASSFPSVWLNQSSHAKYFCCATFISC